MNRALIIGGGEGIRKDIDYNEYEKIAVVNVGIKDPPVIPVDYWINGLTPPIFKQYSIGGVENNYINMVCSPFYRKHNEYIPKEYIDNRIIIVEEELYDSLYSQTISKPTTGILGIYYLISLGYKLDIIGYDWYKSNNRYARNIRTVFKGIHNIDKEKDICLSLKERGYIYNIL